MKPFKILAILMCCRGDIVAVTGAINKLRERHPEAWIDFVCLDWLADIIEGWPAVNRILAEIPDTSPYNLVVEFDKNIPSWNGWPENPTKAYTFCFLDQINENYENIEYYVARNKNHPQFPKPYIALVTSAGWDSRVWQSWKWEEIICKIHLNYPELSIVQVGGPQSEIYQQAPLKGVIFADNVTPAQDADTIADAILYLGVDTFGLNASIAVETRVFCIMGVTSPHYNPTQWPVYIGPKGVAVEREDHDIKKIDVDDVWERLKPVLNEQCEHFRFSKR
jgi:ADP-heptose:LPS heptosyltransferase